jgi:hypothetical protein
VVGNDRTSHLPIQVCILKDNGFTWDRHELEIVGQPFRDIVLSPDGTLICGIFQLCQRTDGYENLYHVKKRLGSRPSNIFLTSKDNGQTWGEKRVLSNIATEAVLLRCKKSKWLAAVFIWSKKSEMEYLSDGGNGYLQSFSYVDKGYTWSEPFANLFSRSGFCSFN